MTIDEISSQKSIKDVFDSYPPVCQHKVCVHMKIIFADEKV